MFTHTHTPKHTLQLPPPGMMLGGTPGMFNGNGNNGNNNMIEGSGAGQGGGGSGSSHSGGGPPRPPPMPDAAVLMGMMVRL